MSHTEQRHSSIRPNPVGQHAGAGQDSVWEREDRTQALPCLIGHSQTSSAWQWSLSSMGGFEDREKDGQASFGGGTDNTIRRCRISVEGLPYCQMG